MPIRKATTIDRATFKELLTQYHEHIPSKLEDLERFRMTELPATLQQRIKDGDEVHVTKDELVKLVEWKLKHGTFRPKLLQLVQSNAETEITSATASAFNAHLSKPDAHGSARALTSLKGIGIATASLIMSTLDPGTAPFFGDEVFRWVMWNDDTLKSSGGHGWDRKIAYNAKEYERFVALVDTLRRRLDVPAIEIEQVGYTLGRLKVDLEENVNIAGKHKRKADAMEEKIRAESETKQQQRKRRDKAVASSTDDITYARKTRSSSGKR